MTGRPAITSAGSPDAFVPHVRGVVRGVAWVKELLRRHSAGNFTTPRTVRVHRHPDTAAHPSLQLTSIVTPLALSR
jgi:hypothetical protein